MKKLIVALSLALAPVAAMAQAAAPAAPAAPAALTTVSGTAAEVVQVVQAAQVNLPSGAWAGKFTFNSPLSLAAYQSFTSAEVAYGVHWSPFVLSKGSYALLDVGVFAGVYQPILSQPLNSSPHTLAGPTLFVPGSALDWALGTNYGAAWLPSLKTGILFGYDMTRPNTIHVKPTFMGPGISWAFGAAPTN